MQNTVTISGCDAGHYLISDQAYDMQNWLIKPVLDTGTLTPEQHIYIYRVSDTESTVDKCFGRLKEDGAKHENHRGEPK